MQCKLLDDKLHLALEWLHHFCPRVDVFSGVSKRFGELGYYSVCSLFFLSRTSFRSRPGSGICLVSPCVFSALFAVVKRELLGRLDYCTINTIKRQNETHPDPCIVLFVGASREWNAVCVADEINDSPGSEPNWSFAE